MGVTTSIEWCDHTFNPWIGCTRISAACDHCYAETLARRYGWATWGPGEPRKLTGEANWRQPLAWNRAAERAGVRRRVFCASLADIFDAEVPDAWRGEVMALVEKTPHLDWLLLTKRPQVAKKWAAEEPLPANVWLGTTVENQAMADLRIPILLSIKATKRFLSCEPLLGPLNLLRHLSYVEDGEPIEGVPKHDGIDWVIAGGESGPKARPCHPDWARSLRDQCQTAGVPFFWKQWGEWAASGPVVDDDTFEGGQAFASARGGRMSTVCADPDGARVRMVAPGIIMERVGKAAAGAMLDGREWREFPT